MVAFITLVGRVTRVEAFAGPSDSPGLEFTLAVEAASLRRDGTRRETVRTIYRATCHAEVARAAARVVRPGSLIAVTGRLCPYDWKDRHHSSRVAFEVVVAEVVGLEGETPHD